MIRLWTEKGRHDRITFTEIERLELQYVSGSLKP
jgi:hypothetical protein